MSRIGKKPISLPKGVEVTRDGSKITVKGPKGALTQEFPEEITFVQEENQLLVQRPSDDKASRTSWLGRSLLMYG